MGRLATSKPVEQIDSANYGVELKEVNFKEFDRRKTPRIDTYASFVKYVDNAQVDRVLIEIIS